MRRHVALLFAFVLGFCFAAAAIAQPGGVKPGSQPPAPTRPPISAGSTNRPSGSMPAATAPAAGVTGQPNAAEQGPKDPIVDEAIEFFKKGEIQKTVEKLTEAANKNPVLPPAKIMLARMYGNAGQPQFARIALEQAAVENPDHPDVYITFGGLALTENRLLDAALQFKEGLACVPRGKWTPEQQKNIKLNCLSGLAAVGEKRGKWDMALEHLQAIMELEPKNGRERNRLGRALFMLEKRDQAADELEKAAKDDPALPPYSNSMAQLYLGIRNKPKAEEWFNFGLKLDPKSAKVKQAFANFLMDEGRLDDAAKQIKDILDAEPKNLEVRYLAGLLARFKKDLDGAERIFNELLLEKPDAQDVKNQLALTLIQSKDNLKQRRALELAEANVKAAPRSAEAGATFGWALFKSNRIDDAEKIFNQIYQQNAGMTSDTAYFMANVLADRGKLDDVKKLLRSAVDSEGRFFHRQEATEWLKNLERRP